MNEDRQEKLAKARLAKEAIEQSRKWNIPLERLKEATSEEELHALVMDLLAEKSSAEDAVFEGL